MQWPKNSPFDVAIKRAQRSADDMLQSRTSDLKDEGHFHPFAAAAAAAVHSIDDDNNNNNNKTWII